MVLFWQGRGQVAWSSVVCGCRCHDPPFGLKGELPLEWALHLGCCNWISPLSVLPKVRQEGQARSRVVAGGAFQRLDKRVHFV